MLALRHPYIEVQTAAGLSYGGAQQFSDRAMLRRCGCGVAAALDTLLYLSRLQVPGSVACFRRIPDTGPIPFHVYADTLRALSARYFPVIPYAGINGFMLALGMQRFFFEQHLPYSARWCMASARLWERTGEMLRADLPVIMAAGPNFPCVWEQHRVLFYRKTGAGTYMPANAVKAHCFTVTGMDECWLRLSSWGRLYYLSRQEYDDYVNHHSAGFVSNILYISKR